MFSLNMEKLTKKEKIFSIIATIFAFSGVAFCLASLGLSVSNSEYSKYTLATAEVLLGLNAVCLHLSTHKKNTFFNYFSTILMFFLALFVGLSSYNIYFLTISFFLYSLMIATRRILFVVENPSRQNVLFGILSVSFCFTFSFIFLFPSIYQRHATSVSNWNFIVLSYTIIVLCNCVRNIFLPVFKKYRLDVFLKVLSSTFAFEILMGLMLLITLCSVYFTLVEPKIVSFADALWYSFSVVTTIGFGDFTVQTTLGRILSVILGIYGIVVVGLVTSIIVELYSNMYHKREEQRLKEIEKKEKEIEEVVLDNQEKEKEESSKK